MIDNLISNQLKEIWINLELYLKFINFLIFRDFSRIFLNFSEFFMNFLGFLELKIKFSNFSYIYKCVGDVAQSGASNQS